MDARPIPFGKYKGTRIDTLAHDDPDYLRWALENVALDRWQGLTDHILEALRRAGESA